MYFDISIIKICLDVKKKETKLIWNKDSEFTFCFKYKINITVFENVEEDFTKLLGESEKIIINPCILKERHYNIWDSHVSSP